MIYSSANIQFYGLERLGNGLLKRAGLEVLVPSSDIGLGIREPYQRISTEVQDTSIPYNQYAVWLCLRDTLVQERTLISVTKELWDARLGGRR